VAQFEVEGKSLKRCKYALYLRESKEGSAPLIPWLLKSTFFASSSDAVIDFLSLNANEKLELVFNLNLYTDLALFNVQQALQMLTLS